MTIRKETSYLHNRWYDGQRVDQVDMNIEQTRNVDRDASIVQNHFGSGVVPAAPTQTVLFDTEDLFPDQVALIASNDFDGTGLRPLAQPTDSTLGNQLEVELLDGDISLNGASSVGGRLSTKVLIVGVDFQGNPQYDRLYFYKKEKQVTSKHYTQILAVFFNDFYGNDNCSRQLGGRVVIREAKSFQLSRDAVMIAQDVEPNLFFRDFKVANPSIGANPTVALYQTIQTGIGSEYSVDSLNINTTVKRDFELGNDVVTRLAQKFLAETNNIQKISLLLGVRRDTSATEAQRYDWSGELIVSIYELQSTVSCPTDLVPELAIEFDPNPVPLTQFSIDQAELARRGYVLSDVLQPIDFIFTDTILGDSNNTVIVPGRHYAISIGRAGDASTGTIFTGIGNSQSDDDRFSIFTGTWTDVPDEDMWYQVWTDSAKVADGQGYDNGNGVEIPKTDTNDLGAIIDNSFGKQAFVDTGRNTLNTALIEAVLEQSVQEQDERTGNPVFARQKYEPSFSFVTTSTLSTLRESSEPVVIGCARDSNPRGNENIDSVQMLPGLVKGNVFTVVNPDPDLISQQLVGSALIPNYDCSAIEYKIVDVQLCVDGYGDVNGDGVIDDLDVARCAELVGESLSSTSTQGKIRDGYIDTLELLRADVDGDGYVSASDLANITSYVAKTLTSFSVGSTFRHLEIYTQRPTGRFDGYYDCGDDYIRLDGYSGQNTVLVSSLSATELMYYGYNGLPDMEAADAAFTTVPFVSVPFRVRSSQFWQDYLLQFRSDAREVPAVFSYTTDSTLKVDEQGSCLDEDAEGICSDVFVLGNVCSAGRNDFYVPNNLIIGNGQIVDVNGNTFKQDFEVHIVTLELSDGYTFNRAVLDVFNKLLVNQADGMTAGGYPAARFADCTYVESDALIRNQVRFGVGIQSMTPNFDGYDESFGYGIISNDTLAAFMDQSTGILYFSMKDIVYDSIFPEIRTKIQIIAYLKKGGWNNTPLTVEGSQLFGLLDSNDPYP